METLKGVHLFPGEEAKSIIYHFGVRKARFSKLLVARRARRARTPTKNNNIARYSLKFYAGILRGKRAVTPLFADMSVSARLRARAVINDSPVGWVGPRAQRGRRSGARERRVFVLTSGLCLF